MAVAETAAVAAAPINARGWMTMTAVSTAAPAPQYRMVEVSWRTLDHVWGEKSEGEKYG